MNIKNMLREHNSMHSNQVPAVLDILLMWLASYMFTEIDTPLPGYYLSSHYM